MHDSEIKTVLKWLYRPKTKTFGKSVATDSWSEIAENKIH